MEATVTHGRYTVIRKLADGGMAEIFLATQHGSQGFEKQVVLKRIHAAMIADQQFRNMLIDEAHISMSLSHNNIVHVLDLGEDRGRYFLALELVDGWDMGRVLKRANAAGQPIPDGLGLFILAQMCRALDYAHTKLGPEGHPLGIIHRDVSPQNILLSEQGEVKLADFGIAKARRKRDQTDSGVVKGKISFMSPEQSMGQDLDPRSDLYALGSILYECVTGTRPYDGPTDLEVLLRIQKGEYVAPEIARPDLDPAIIRIIKKSMEFDRERRYPGAHAMLVDVEAVLRGRHGSPSQTELKLWLQQLAAFDGEVPIGRLVVPTNESSVAVEIAAGHAIDLGPHTGEHMDMLSDEDMMLEGGQEELSYATDDTVMRHSGRQTVNLAPKGAGASGLRKPLATEVSGEDATSLQDLRVTDSMLQEGPSPIRSTQSARGPALAAALVVAVIAGGAGFGLWSMRNKPDAGPQAVDSSEAAVKTAPLPVKAQGRRIVPLPSGPEHPRRDDVAKTPIAAPAQTAPKPRPATERIPPAAAKVPTEPADEPAPAEPAPRTWRRGDELPPVTVEPAIPTSPAPKKPDDPDDPDDPDLNVGDPFTDDPPEPPSAPEAPAPETTDKPAPEQ